MKVIVYPADNYGCGHHRMIWPARALQQQGYDVLIDEPNKADRLIKILFDRERVVKVGVPAGVDVLVFQRVTHRWLAQAIPIIRKGGVAVVVDVDDDLQAIHPSNPAFNGLHPGNEGRTYTNGRVNHHSWHYLTQACKAATMVTVSTPALLPRYAAHGRGRVVDNYLAPHYYQVQHTDSDLIGWPASLHSHPNDPSAVGNSIARLVSEGARFDVSVNPIGVAKAFGLTADPPGVLQNTSIYEWPTVISQLGIGIVPLADTRFNQAKSRLKGLELAAANVPWVASPRAEYVKLNTLGAGLLADRPKIWYRLLKELWQSEARRTELAESGRQVAESQSLELHAWRWLTAWEDALKIQHGHAHAFG